MTLIEWDDSLKLGIGVVDRQHEHLVEIINRLHTATMANRGADVISEILDELIIYTATHFRMEEKYFAKFEYPEAEEHKREHEALVEKVGAFANAFEQTPRGARSALAMELLQFLQIWWRYHMMVTDSKFVRLFREKGLK